jgi:polyribonucleotide nucleotidyltransferase
MEETGIKEGDMMEVKLTGTDPKTGKYKLSRRVLLEKPEGWVEKPPREDRPKREGGERGERGDRGDRGDRDRRRR